MRGSEERRERREKVKSPYSWRGMEGLHDRSLRFGVAAAMVALAMFLAAALPAHAAQQKQQKDNKNNSDASAIVSPVPLPDPQAVDLVVSQMLGAWQIGNVEMLHNSYADDVIVVSGIWEQPLVGWENYAKAYQAQFARTGGSRLDRSNSYTKVQGDSAWVTYQWQFSGQVDGNSSRSVGHTTLVLQKRSGVWRIVLNHTSAVPTAQPGAVTPQAVPPAPNAAPR